MNEHSQDDADRNVLVSIVSEAGPLSSALVRQLVAKGLPVNIFADNSQAWLRAFVGSAGQTPQFYNLRAKVDFAPKTVFISELFTNCSDGHGAVEKDGKALHELFTQDVQSKRKILVFPRKTESAVHIALQKMVGEYANVPRTKLVFVESLFSPQLAGNNFDPLYFVLDLLSQGKGLPSLSIRPTLPGVVARQIIKPLLTLSFDTQPVSVVGKKLEVTKLVHPTASRGTATSAKFVFFETVEKVVVKGPSKRRMLSLVGPFTKTTTKPTVEPSTLSKKTKKRKGKLAKVLFLGLFSFFLFEMFSIATSFAAFTIAISAYRKGNLNVAKTASATAPVALAIARKPISTLSTTPVLGSVFWEIDEGFGIVERGMDTVFDLLRNMQALTVLQEKVFGNQNYQVADYSGELALLLEHTAREMSFLEASTNQNSLTGKLFAKYLKSIGDTKEKLVHFQKIARALPVLLGSDLPKTYLLVVQDNTNLRPTGGVIRDFVLLKVDGGRLVDMSHTSASVLDESLLGFIEPPVELEGLGVANWKTPYANWKANFPESAERVEWFVDKGLSQPVDGVVAIDSLAISNLLEIVGPIQIASMDQPVDKENLADLLGSAADREALLLEISKRTMESIVANKGFGLRGLVWLNDMLVQKHVQVFLHNASAQKAIYDLGFTGNISKAECGQANCIDDGLVFAEFAQADDANSADIKRTLSLQVDVSEGVFTKKLTVEFQNMGAKDYETYFKIHAAPSADFEQSLVLGGNSQYTQEVTISKTFGRVEAGLPVTVVAGENASIVFSWTELSGLNFSTLGGYNFFIRKHPGTVGDHVAASFSFPETVSAQADATLTKSAQFGYNTDLVQDKVLHFSW